MNTRPCAVIGPAEAESIRRAYGGELPPDRQVEVFRHSDRVFPTRIIACGPRRYPLPQDRRPFDGFRIRSGGRNFGLEDYVALNRVAGLLVIVDGAIALERYEFGNDEATRWTSMSIAKSVSTTLVGVALHEGLIRSVDDPLTRYLPELARSSYRGVSIRQLLQMTSGVRWDDTHTDPNSDRRSMLELQISQEPGSILRYVASRPRDVEPGVRWNYSTGETHVVGALLRAAVGRWLADYLSERIWAPFGMEADATWWLESPQGLEVAGSGVNAMLRDYGRFGLFMMHDGIVDGVRVLPEGWVREATAPRLVGGAQLDYGYMWWPVPGSDGAYSDGAFSARGIFGQYLYVNPARRIVIAVWSARARPKGSEVVIDNDFFNAMADAIR